MALYKHPQFLLQSAEDEFDKTFQPGNIIAWSGIYRCSGCGNEIVHTFDKPLPPQDHHHHSPQQGKIRWQLVVTDYRARA
jgi:hypothetical protein